MTPVSMHAAETTPERFLSEEACQALMRRVQKLCTGGGEVALYIRSEWTGNVRWARNAVISGGDTTVHEITVTRLNSGMQGQSLTTRTDDAGLLECVRRAEDRLRHRPRDFNEDAMRKLERYDTPTLWYDETFAVDAAARGAEYRTLVEPVMAAGLLSAGYLEISAAGNGVVNSAGLFAYVPETRAEYSVTVRNAKGTGSGWAGKAEEDWRKVDARQLTAIALDKCQRSIDPVAIEPGRYTVILEPQAVADLMYPLVHSLSRLEPEWMNIGPWLNRQDTFVAPDIIFGAGSVGEHDVRPTGDYIQTRITQQVLDARITINADPMDPDGPYVPFAPDSTPMRPVKWIDPGVLKQLSYPRRYGTQSLNKPDPLNNNYAFRMSGGTPSISEMIASTERGLLVTRLVNIRDVDYNTLLVTGTTADGLWLIERGKITGPVKNFRFRESPLYAFNNLETLGTPVRVFMQQPTIVPPAKIRDFSMTSLADSV